MHTLKHCLIGEGNIVDARKKDENAGSWKSPVLNTLTAHTEVEGLVRPAALMPR
jgi:hypothetical protein